MSDTPRTDHVQIRADSKLLCFCDYVVEAYFCRKLEIELNASNERIRQLESIIIAISEEKKEACESMRKGIEVCGSFQNETYERKRACSSCLNLQDKTCALRKYLASHGDEKAWKAQ